MWRAYGFERTRDGKLEWGITGGDSPEDAMYRVLGSHPEKYKVTYAIVFLPDENEDENSDFTREWGNYASPSK